MGTSENEDMFSLVTHHHSNFQREGNGWRFSYFYGECNILWDSAIYKPVMLEAGLHIRNLRDSKSHDCDRFGIFRDPWGTCIFKLKLVFTLNKKKIFSWNFYPDKLNNIPQEFAHFGYTSQCVCYHCNYKFLAMKEGTAWEAEYDRSRWCYLFDLPPRVKRQESALSASLLAP